MKSDFIKDHGLWTEAQRAAAAGIEAEVKDRGLGVIRLSAVDQHGVLRGKTIVASELPGAFGNGCTFVSSILAKDTSCRSVFPVFTPGAGLDMAALQGAADILMVPDPTTFKILPWAPHSGWMLCDLYFADGTAVPFSTRQIYRGVLERLHDKGFDYVAGLEVEFHIFKLENPRLAPADAGQPGTPPEVSLITQGYQLLAEHRYDRYDDIFEVLRRHLEALGLPLRTLEVELGPSQCEFTFRPDEGLAPADTMVLLRSAVKQICARHGYHATFMCRPQIPNVCSSGWHLHQSLRRRGTSDNVFAPAARDRTPLSPLGMSYMAGLLVHGAASAAFATPTLNGYRRYKPFALAPDRVVWGQDNRGAMIRVVGVPGNPGTYRIENRIGEPAANPYLYMASQILAGLDGIDQQLDPGPAVDAPYAAEAATLPRSLGEALLALRGDKCFRAGLGKLFVEDYFLRIKEAEIARYRESLASRSERDPVEVSDWEQREYFELF
ncbi:MAG TPA: glutamine synthetase family protein [Alphaproteobacteria bacterium]|nr:glutamine synthetase family protein [Alphaproteobacteria bacterium]